MIITQEPNQTQNQLRVRVVHACKFASLNRALHKVESADAFS